MKLFEKVLDGCLAIMFAIVAFLAIILKLISLK